MEDYIKPRYPDINKLIIYVGIISVKNNQV